MLAAARDRGLSIPAVEQFTSTPGRGVRAVVDAHVVQVASPAVLDESATGAVRAVVEAAQSAGRTAVVVVVDGTPAGVLALADRIRPAAADTVTALTALTGATPVLLTGDNPGAAGRLATEAGISDVHAGLLPADKVDRVWALQADGARVLLVGDGMNDAPALATVDLGVATGSRGSDLALQSADAVLVRDDLTARPAVIALSRRARRVVIANLIIAATFITALVAWDLFGHLPLPLGVAGHEGSTVIVGLNGLRLLTGRSWPRTRTGQRS